MKSNNHYLKFMLLPFLISLVTFEQVLSISVAAGKTEEEHNEICRLTRDDKQGGRKNTPCAFPFKFDGRSYDGVCTSKSDPNGELWCSTKTDKSGRHKPGGGHWGYCRDGCGKKPSKQVKQRTIVEAREYCNVTISEGGRQPNTQCVWPFRYKKKLYDGVCTNVGDAEGRYWCSTRTGKRGKRKHQHLKGGNWGYCQPGCEVEPTMDLDTSTQRPRSTAPTKRRRHELKTICEGMYCDVKFWEQNKTEIEQIERKQGHWEDFNKKSAVGNYLPNERDTTCGLSTKTGYIVGGENTKIGEFPFLAALGYRSKHNRMFYSCGATLINRRYVITAAHCHDESSKDSTISEVVLGDHDLSRNPDCTTDRKLGLQCFNKPVQRFAVIESDITVHEGWDKNNVMKNANDIALVRLEKPAFTASEIASGVHVIPICLPWGRLPNRYVANYPSEVNLKNEHFVMGWGRTNNKRGDAGDRFTGGAHSNVLQKLKVPFIPNVACRENYPSFQNITTNKQICAGGERGKDSCQGDSGGPLIVREDDKGAMYLKGITSFGTNKCGFGYPGVYTDIEYYIDWIKKHLKP